MTDLNTPPILVNSGTGRDQAATGIRYTLLAASAVASALGYVEAAGKFSALLVTAGPIATAAVFLWGQWSARHQSKTKAALAAELPDSIARFK